MWQQFRLEENDGGEQASAGGAGGEGAPLGGRRGRAVAQRGLAGADQGFKCIFLKTSANI